MRGKRETRSRPNAAFPRLRIPRGNGKFFLFACVRSAAAGKLPSATTFSPMSNSVSRSRIKKYIFQFSVFAENKVGCLNFIAESLVGIDVHILGMSCLDQTDCAIVRFVPDYAEAVEKLLKKANISYSKTRVIAVEFSGPKDLTKVTQSLRQAEINIHYLYPLFCRPEGRCGLILSTNDLELSESVLSGYGIRVLELDDIAR